MISINEDRLAQSLTQTQAACLAVIISDIRRALSDLGRPQEIEESELEAQLTILEQSCLKSIMQNDGEVVSWIGHAAKLLNPLLEYRNSAK